MREIVLNYDETFRNIHSCFKEYRILQFPFMSKIDDDSFLISIIESIRRAVSIHLFIPALNIYRRTSFIIGAWVALSFIFHSTLAISVK